MKKVLMLVLLMTFSIAFIFILQSVNENFVRNGFTRNLKPIGVQLNEVLKLPSKSFRFSGPSDLFINLKDLKIPDVKYTVDLSLSRISKEKIKLPSKFQIKSGDINMGTAASYRYVTNGSSSEFVIVSENSSSYFFKISRFQFDQSNLISANSIVVRENKLHKKELTRALTKVSLFGDAHISKEFLLEKQIDGFFCTDGLLQYDHRHSSLFYLYFYRGSFLCLDTNLNLTYTGKTIDTVTTAKMKLTELTIKAKNGIKINRTQANPANNLVNRNFTLDSDFIYIQSVLKADNEKHSDFRKNQVIDVYLQKTGKYIYSFYIPKYKGIRLREFQITGRTIFAIFDDYLVSFHLNVLRYR